jgi:hypothetical protein
MKRKGFWIGLVMILVLAGVSFFMTHDLMLHNMVFRGQSDSWKGEYRIHGWWLFSETNDRTEFDSRVDGTLTLTYTEEVEAQPKLDHFEIHYDLGPCGGGYRIEDDTVMDQIYRIERRGTGVPNKDTVMTVTLVMNDKRESFELVADQ